MNMEEFNYTKAVEALERIAAKVEDPSTGLDDIDKYVKESEVLIEQCRKYLRSVRERVYSSFGV